MMRTKHLKQSILALAVCMVSGISLTACDTGTKPGDTNTERSDIKDAGELSGAANDANNADTADLEEKYYGERADTTVIGEGAYSGEGKPVERDDLEKKD